MAGSGGLFKSGIPVGVYHIDTEEGYEVVHFFSKLSQLTFVKLVSFEEENKQWVQILKILLEILFFYIYLFYFYLFLYLMSLILIT